ncbi:hypothetical protein SDJN03_00764, partial [Cucurbita argyrosperma subsp. sororia]
MTPPVQTNQPNNPYDSDDDDLTPEELSRYNEAALASDGFDVPTLRDSPEVGLIVPVSEKLLSKPYLRECAEKAISQYNIENGTNYEFVKIVKANHRVAWGLLYYITFDVKQIGTEFLTTTFEAQVLYAIDDSLEMQAPLADAPPRPSIVFIYVSSHNPCPCHCLSSSLLPVLALAHVIIHTPCIRPLPLDAFPHPRLH